MSFKWLNPNKNEFEYLMYNLSLDGELQELIFVQVHKSQPRARILGVNHQFTQHLTDKYSSYGFQKSLY